MPTPAQLRDKRLDMLTAEFQGKNITSIDPIYEKALELFPRITLERAEIYAEAVLRMLKTK